MMIHATRRSIRAGIRPLLIVAALAAITAACDEAGSSIDTETPSRTVPSETVESPPSPEGGSPSPEGSVEPGLTVTIVDRSFDPAEFTVGPDEGIVFVNRGDETHSVTVDGENRSGDILPGNSYTLVFDADGRHQLRCGYHPTMEGTITVE